MKLIQSKNIFQTSSFFVLLPKELKIVAVDFKSNIKYEDLHNLDDQKKLISNNIRAFVTNNICEHTLLWGAKG